MFYKYYSIFGVNVRIEAETEAIIRIADKCIGYFEIQEDDGKSDISFKILFPSRDLIEERKKAIESKYYLFSFDKLTGYRIGEKLIVTDGVSTAECETSKGIVTMFLDKGILRQERFFAFVFFYLILMEMLRYRGFYYVHSSCISIDGKALIIPGDTGAGKTTLCITLLREGYKYLSDDGVLLRREGDTVRTYALPGEFHIDPSISKRFKELEDVKYGEKYGEGPKRAFSADKFYPGQFIHSAEQRFIIYPEIKNQRASRLCRISRAKALALFIPHSLLVMMDSDIAAAHLDVLKRAVEISECFRLESGQDLLDNPSNVVKMIKKELIGAD
ncbi:MAG: hypothetical protein D6734_05780 [Candidatus Schekmanbacteria bacterium]|nr:MAG: hypothetical protein D6734_05780 [Candidatus Schekmanbacteria bacterium]